MVGTGKTVQTTVFRTWRFSVKCSARTQAGKKSNTRPSVIATVAPAWKSANVSQLGATLCYCTVGQLQRSISHPTPANGRIGLQVSRTIPLAFVPWSPQSIN